MPIMKLGGFCLTIVAKYQSGGSRPLIQLDDVDKSFGTNLVLKNVDFALMPGEIHALCGENGAGKSTCLGLLYGFTNRLQATYFAMAIISRLKAHHMRNPWA